MPDDDAVADTGSTQNGAKPRNRWRQAELKRALLAAEQAGLSSYRVEIAPDGTIAIVVGAPSEGPAEPSPYRDLFGT